MIRRARKAAKRFDSRWVRHRPTLEHLEDRTVPDAVGLASIGREASTLLVKFREAAPPHAVPGTVLGGPVPSLDGLYRVQVEANTHPGGSPVRGQLVFPFSDN